MLPSERGRERWKERESKNKSTYLLCFFNGREREREREREQKEREALASPFASIFKIDYPCDLQHP
jgi:hypothetical protein